MEKEVLGFYLTSHPLAEHQSLLAAYCTHTTTEASTLKNRAEVMLGGILSAIKFAHVKNPKPGNPSRYAMFDLEDADGMIRTIVWPEQFARYEQLIKPDAVLVVRGAIDKRPGSEEANLIVNELIPIEELHSRCARGATIRLMETEHGPTKLKELHGILGRHPGHGELHLLLCLGDGRRVTCRCDGLHVSLSNEMRAEVDGLLGAGNLRLVPGQRTVAGGG
jgi:DNA polymerase-3 subunit alpha